MIEDLIIQSVETLLKQQQGKLINKTLHTGDAAAKVLPQKVLDTISTHRKFAAFSSLIPTYGMIGTLASVWHMYYSINEIIGISFSKNMVKSIATGVASNMAGYFTASTILNHIPFVNILSAPVMYAATCIQGFIYIKILTVITSTDKDSVDGVIARVINENSSLIKQLLKEILGLGTKSQTRTAVSLAVLSRRRQGEANKIKQNTSKLIKYIAITAVLSYAGISYCSYNDAYTRGVTDLWITSMTRTDWNVWWYLWGLIAIISALSFVIVTYSCCFGYAEYFKIKSTPLSSFAKSDEYLSDDCNLEHIIKEEVRCKKWNKCVILLSHIIMVLISAFIAYLCYNYCSFNESSQMIEVKYLFMDASMENDTNYVWYIIAACGIVSVTFGVYNIYMFVKGLFSK